MGLTEKQKKNLPVSLQKAILNSQKKKKPTTLASAISQHKKVKKAKEGGQLHGKDLKAMYREKMETKPYRGKSYKK